LGTLCTTMEAQCVTLERRSARGGTQRGRPAAGVPRLHVSLALAAPLLDLRSGAVPSVASIVQQASAVAWAPGAPSGSVTVQLLNAGNLTVGPASPRMAAAFLPYARQGRRGPQYATCTISLSHRSSGAGC
jgi:hypothetical protein